MLTAPQRIDNARVIAYVVLDPSKHRDTDSIHLIANGTLQTWFYGLAVAQYDHCIDEVYLFYCDSDWETENDTVHSSIQEVFDSAQQKFGVQYTDWHFTKIDGQLKN